MLVLNLFSSIYLLNKLACLVHPCGGGWKRPQGVIRCLRRTRLRAKSEDGLILNTNQYPPGHTASLLVSPIIPVPLYGR